MQNSTYTNPPPHRDTGGRENGGTRNPEGAGRGRGVGWRVEEAEATKRRGGEAEDTGGKGTEEVTARRAEKRQKRQKSQRRKHERHREEGRTECRKTLMEHNSPQRSHRSASDEKDETSPNETKEETKTTGEEEKSEEEEDRKIDAGQTTEQERQTRG